MKNSELHLIAKYSVRNRKIQNQNPFFSHLYSMVCVFFFFLQQFALYFVNTINDTQFCTLYHVTEISDLDQKHNFGTSYVILQVFTDIWWMFRLTVKENIATCTFKEVLQWFSQHSSVLFPRTPKGENKTLVTIVLKRKLLSYCLGRTDLCLMSNYFMSFFFFMNICFLKYVQQQV